MTAPAPPDRYDLVVAAHRLPVDHFGDPPAPVRWREPAGGAFPAMRRAVAAYHGAWTGWTGVTDTDTDTLPFPFDGLWLHPVPLSEQDANDYYHGHCATTLAPLYHACVEPPVFRRQWREAYRTINRRFALSAAKLAAPGGAVWVHDYHLQLVPGHLRRLRPDLRIGVLLHSPFPPAELFMQLPTRAEIMSGLLGADLVGFQQSRSVTNFLDLADDIAGAPANDGGVRVGDRRVKVDTFPTSIDVAEVERLATDPDLRARAATIRAELNSPRTVFLSMVRLDHAEGIEQSLDAYASLLADGRLDPNRTTFVVVVASGGEDTPQHHRLRDRIDRKVGQINGLYSRVGHLPVHCAFREPDRRELIALYLAADVLLATPLRQGMTLVAQEFVASRVDDSGQLVLSEFSGACADLTGAVIVNPHDGDALRRAMLTAAADAAPGSDVMRGQRQRLRSLSGPAGTGSWADRFLSVLGDTGASDGHYRPGVKQPTAASQARVLASARIPPVGPARVPTAVS